MPTNKVIQCEDALGIGHGPGFAGIKVDTTDKWLQFNPDGTMRTVVDLSSTQTITGDKTFTGTVVMSGAVTKTEFADGTAAAPSITFSSDLDSGIYRIGADNVGIALGGAIEFNLTTVAFSPGASDGSALGTTALMWSDVFLASGGVINFNNGNMTITHSAGVLTLAGGTIAGASLTAPVIGVATGTSLAVTGAVTSSGGGIGYATGAGGTVDQLTSKSTAVTLSKLAGAITLHNAALAADAIASFVLTNTFIAATDVLLLNHISGGTVGAYVLNAQCAAGSATINVANRSAGSLSDAVVIQFLVIKGVNA